MLHYHSKSGKNVSTAENQQERLFFIINMSVEDVIPNINRVITDEEVGIFTKYLGIDENPDLTKEDKEKAAQAIKNGIKVNTNTDSPKKE